MKSIDEHINSLIQDIILEIETKNVDVVSLCENLSFNPNEFINYINNFDLWVILSSLIILNPISLWLIGLANEAFIPILMLTWFFVNVANQLLGISYHYSRRHRYHNKVEAIAITVILGCTLADNSCKGIVIVA